jgi:ribosomal protein S18 acetylase RimI-like enzyme
MPARAALPGDAPLVTAMVLESDCGMLTALFGPRVRELVTWLQGRGRNTYARENALVMEETGALVGSLVRHARSWETHTAALLLRWYGPGLAARLPRLARAGAALAGLAPDDWYVSHVAVLSSSRGRGAGTELLSAATKAAAAQGARRLVLDVEDHNTAARAFYARAGFAPDGPLVLRLGRAGAFAFQRLSRPVNEV